MRRRRAFARGFSLIEVMISVAIVGILSSVAIPSYVRYQLRSKTAEARLNLGAIKTCQIVFYGGNDNYANVNVSQPAAAPGPNKVRWPGNACPAACNRTNTVACTEFACVNFQPNGRVYYQYGGAARVATAALTSEFAVGARGDLDADGVFGSFAYQSNNVTGGTLGMLADGLSGCAAGRTANVIAECTYGRY